jgi:hypothetical protein
MGVRRAFEWFQNAPPSGGHKGIVRPYDYGFVGEMSVVIEMLEFMRLLEASLHP